MERFAINKITDILIYGAAFGGTILYGKMKQQNYRIIGFVDQRADEIGSLCGLPVYAIDRIKDIPQTEPVIVIIAVKNVFEHSRIARNLIKHGIYHIIYKPYAVLKGYVGMEAQELFDTHNQLIDHGYCNNRFLCAANEIERHMELKKEYLLDEAPGTETVFLPLIMLFENKDISGLHRERNVCFLYPHIQFFRYLQGDVNASAQYYMEYCDMAARELGSFSTTKAWERNVIRNRAEVYHQMNHAFLFQKDFFVSNAPAAEWNEKGYFNLESGKHRAAFFASRRLMYIPVRISHQDAEQWINGEQLGSVNQILQENEMFELKAPIEHPYFFQMPCMAENFFYGLCCVLAEKLGGVFYENPMDHVLEQKHIYLKVDDCGFLSRFFRRCGASVFYANQNDRELMAALDQLFYIALPEQGAQKEVYDLAVIQIQCIEDFHNQADMFCADRCFILAEDTILQEFEGLERLYCGMAWEKCIGVGYLEKNRV